MDQRSENLVQEICMLINSITTPNSDPNVQMKSNGRLNEILRFDLQKSPDPYIDVGIFLLQNTAILFPSIIPDEYSLQIVMNYGFNLLEAIVQYHWYEMGKPRQHQLKILAQECLETNLSNLLLNRPESANSPLILNACGRWITEMFIREWPNNWKDFLPKITSKISLAALYTFINITDYLQKLYLPPNSNRRKEITKILTTEKDVIYNYFVICLQIIKQPANISTGSMDFEKLILIKTLEALESYLEWFPLYEEILIEITSIATQPIVGISDERFLNRVKMSSFRCIQTIIKRPVQRLEDSIIMNDIFFDLSENKFANYLVTQMLDSHFNLVKSTKLNSEIFESFLLLIDIAVELVCRLINLFDQDSTHVSIWKSHLNNQFFWFKFVSFSLDCLEYNNANLDEISIRFWILYSRSDSFNQDDSSAKNGKKFTLPITADLKTLTLKLLTVIGRYKLEPKPESCVSELAMIYNIDSYESYLRLFKENKCKFMTIITNLVATYPHLCRTFLFSILKDLLGFRPDDGCIKIPEMIDTGIKSWPVAATFCSALIPKLDFLPEHVQMLEIYFSHLLNLQFDLNQTENIPTINGVLSCISSMSPFYNSFSIALIQKLIENIFSLTVKTGPNHQADQNISDFQNHLNALFIKLAANCGTIFLPHFQMMRTFIDDLINTQQIGLLQSYSLYEGLFILSNHLPMEEQKSFIIDNFIPKISWIATYDLEPETTTFFADIGLAKQPSLNHNQLPYSYNPALIKIPAVLNLLTRLLRRINPKRLHEIFGLKLLDLVRPFNKIVLLIHNLWYYHQTGEENKSRLDAVCHEFYRRYIFEEIPSYYLALMIGSDQSGVLPADKYKSLLKKWDRQTPPQPELVGYYMQQRVWVIYSQSITLINSTLAYLFYIYNVEKNSDSDMLMMIANYIRASNSHVCSNLKFMPLCVYHDIIRAYFYCLTSYCPRDEKFLLYSGCLETLSQFLEFMFAKLDVNLKQIQQDKDELLLGNTEPKCQAPFFARNSIIPIDNDYHQNCLEIIMEAIINHICGDFVLFLNSIFNAPKNIGIIFASTMNESLSINQNQSNGMDEEMDGNDDDGGGCDIHAKDNEPVINAKPKESTSSNNDDGFKDDDYLSKFLLKHNPKCLALVVIGCLQWPINNLRLQICNVNQSLLYSLISRNMINTCDAFFELAEQILSAISRIESTDSEMMNRYLNLVLIIYEKFAVKNHLTEPINQRLSQICGSDLKQWNNLAESFRQNKTGQTKRAQKMLRSLIENISFNELSTKHPKQKQPNVVCLGPSLDQNPPNKNKDLFENDAFDDIEFLSWLLKHTKT